MLETSQGHDSLFTKQEQVKDKKLSMWEPEGHRCHIKCEHLAFYSQRCWSLSGYDIISHTDIWTYRHLWSNSVYFLHFKLRKMLNYPGNYFPPRGLLIQDKWVGDNQGCHPFSQKNLSAKMQVNYNEVIFNRQTTAKSHSYLAQIAMRFKWKMEDSDFFFLRWRKAFSFLKLTLYQV